MVGVRMCLYSLLNGYPLWILGFSYIFLGLPFSPSPVRLILLRLALIVIPCKPLAAEPAISVLSHLQEIWTQIYYFQKLKIVLIHIQKI